MAENKKKNIIIPAAASLAVMALAAGGAIYLNSTRNPAGSEKSASVTAVTTMETASETTAFLTEPEAAETTPEVTDEPTVPDSLGNVSGIFGRVNTTKGKLNIRKSPSSGSDIAGSLEKDSLVYISGEKDGWYRIESGDKKSGYVKADYIVLSQYCGKWNEKYRQIASDICEYFGEEAEKNEQVSFCLKYLDTDTVPELICSYSSGTDDGDTFFQIFSADESCLYVDTRRPGSIEESGYNSETHELFMRRSFRGEYFTALTWSDNGVKEKTFYCTSGSSDSTNDTVLYIIDGQKVSEEKYKEEFSEHSGDTLFEKLGLSDLERVLGNYSAVSDPSRKETIIYPETDVKTETTVRFQDNAFDHFYGMLISDSADVPLWKDSSEKKRFAYEQSGTIVRVTGEDKNTYRISWVTENNDTAEVYVNKKYIKYSRSASSWQDKYDEVVRFRENSNGKTENRYSLADLNYDDVPELICMSDTAQSGKKNISVYSVYDGNLVSFSADEACTDFDIYADSKYLGVTGTGKGEDIQFYSYSQGTFRPAHKFLSYKSSSSEMTYSVDGDEVSEERYYELRSEYIPEENDEEPEDNDENEDDDTDETPVDSGAVYRNLKATDILKKISEYN